MNKPYLFSLVLLVIMMGAPFAGAQQNATSSVSLTNYMDRASLELRHLRSQIETTVHETPLAGQPQLAPYVNALSAAEQALAALKTSATIELARRQAEFESAKEKAMLLWVDYQSAHSPRKADPTPLASRAAEALE